MKNERSTNMRGYEQSIKRGPDSFFCGNFRKDFLRIVHESRVVKATDGSEEPFELVFVNGKSKFQTIPWVQFSVDDNIILATP
jgi:hypothetical protein